jgi:O-antigen/teichoic acid export membrane protein
VSSFLGFGLTAARLFRENAIAYSLIAAATCLACWILVPRFGLLGAAWSILAAAVAACLSQSVLLALNWRKSAAQ